MYLHVYVKQITGCPGNLIYNNTRFLKVVLNHKEPGKQFPMEGLETLNPPRRVIKFHVSNAEESSVSFILGECLQTERLIARCTLPLKWFKPCSFVTDYYPMMPLVNGIVPPHIYIAIQIDIEKKVKPFKCPRSNLLVVPAWKPLPANEEEKNAEIPLSLMRSTPRIISQSAPNSDAEDSSSQGLDEEIPLSFNYGNDSNLDLSAIKPIRVKEPSPEKIARKEIRVKVQPVPVDPTLEKQPIPPPPESKLKSIEKKNKKKKISLFAKKQKKSSCGIPLADTKFGNDVPMAFSSKDYFGDSFVQEKKNKIGLLSKKKKEYSTFD